jgi:predicted O-methyltransferase YrrM
MANRNISTLLRHLARVNLKYAKRPRRYRQLLHTAESIRARCILEIGVFDGVRAKEMIEAASLHAEPRDITYHGFDLFEMIDPEIIAKELSKQPLTKSQVQARIASTRANVSLHQGWTQDTLPEFFAGNPDLQADLIFLDGGHAVETIRSDWENCAPHLARGGTAILDDYYVDCPHLTDRFGCNQLLETLDKNAWQWRVLPLVDRFVHDGLPHNVAMVEIRHRSNA